MQNLLSSSLLSENIKINIYNTVILPAVLYGCGRWSLALRQERRLSKFENRMPRRIFGPKRDEVTVERRKVHNEELYGLHSSPHTIRLITSHWVEHVARMGERRCANMTVMGKPEGYKQLRRPWLRWEDNIKVDLQEVGWGRGMERFGSG